MKHQLFMLIGILSIISLSAKASVVVGKLGQGRVPLSSGLLSLEDPTGKLAIEDIINNPSLEWKPQEKAVPSFGYKQSAYWIKFTTKNIGNKNWHQSFLELSYPPLDSIEFIHIQNGKTKKYITGDSYPFSHRPINHHNYVFPIELTKEFESTIYLRIKSDSSLKIPLTLWTKDAFLEETQKLNLILGISSGIIVAMVAYNLFLFLSFGKISYLFYVVYLFGFGLFLATIQGFSFQFLWPNSIWWNNNGMPILCGISTVAITYFTENFLNTKSLIPRIHYGVLLARLMAFFVIFAALFLSYKTASMSLALMTLFLDVILITAGIACLVKDYKPARFFLIAFIFFCSGQILFAMQTLGIIASNYFTLYGMQIGSALEVILLSLALGDKFRHEQRESKKSITQLNAKLQRYIFQVEQLVDQKTRHIGSIMTHIKQGIFSIIEDAKIDIYYSNYLEKILGEQELSGKKVFDTFIDKFDISADNRSIVETVVNGSLGETSLTFEANQNHLPNEVTYKNKFLELDWQAVEDDENNVERILVVVRDVTHDRELADKSQRQQDELKKIEEMVALPTDRVNSIFLQTRRLLDECLFLIEASPEYSPSSIKVIFINYHTLKGLTRHAGFDSLSNAIHKAETYCSQVRENSSAYSQEEMLKEHQNVDYHLREYLNIRRNKLGIDRDDDVRISIGEIESYLKILEKVALNPAGDNQAGLIKVQSFFQGLCFQPLDEVLVEIFSQIDILSRDLGKPSPNININPSDLLISRNGAELLNSILGH